MGLFNTKVLSMRLKNEHCVCGYDTEIFETLDNAIKAVEEELGI